jgi:hypothetical protein
MRTTPTPRCASWCMELRSRLIPNSISPMRRTAPFGAILAFMMLTVGCSAAPLPQSSPLAVYPKPDYGMDALLGGTLRMLDGCLVVESGESMIAVPVFPSDDAVWDEDAGVLAWRGESYRDGDVISVGGGFVGNSDVEGAYFPEACEGNDAFLVSPF